MLAAKKFNFVRDHSDCRDKQKRYMSWSVKRVASTPNIDVILFMRIEF